ncbi:longitudinals lacking protein, isoforms F/I/K/T-like [Homalodisca vitripennis]|uniref:longitudinals lacking protein, isoforms F/I/K/T-like n=1 Tax=Homalodisca vitripennis TaxID=197043 RepID=UPI001EECBA53|nr:longitudinals lacking protein, isoforms F/I/K/T-like [Homalodisca vitripennis]
MCASCAAESTSRSVRSPSTFAMSAAKSRSSSANFVPTRPSEKRLSIHISCLNTRELLTTQFADSELQKHRCNQCGSEYKQKYSLTFHQRHECGKDPQFACPYCPYKAKRRTSLQSHVVCKHKQPFTWPHLATKHSSD